jgi:hypothetical protein
MWVCQFFKAQNPYMGLWAWTYKYKFPSAPVPCCMSTAPMPIKEKFDNKNVFQMLEIFKIRKKISDKTEENADSPGDR